MRHLQWGLIAIILAIGCDSSATSLKEAPVPRYDVNAIAQMAIADYDKNKDGTIEGSELNACPALREAVAAFDTDGNRRISETEIRLRAEKYSAASSGSIGVACVVNLDGQPLGDAIVKFVPERCMGDTLKQATGKTDAHGRCAEFEIDGKQYRGLSPGLYRIEVSKEGTAIPARFNAQSILGREVFENPRAGEMLIELNLVSK